VVFTPLQGFTNAFIYARPTFMRLREKYPTMTRWGAFKQVFFTADPFAISAGNSSLPRATKSVTESFGKGLSLLRKPPTNNIQDADAAEDPGATAAEESASAAGSPSPEPEESPVEGRRR
jgi:hypothetical protein